MKQVLIQQGQITVQEVPAPVVAPGTVLVQVSHSCISAGTEMSGLQAQSRSLGWKLLAQPQKIKKAWKLLHEQGVKALLHKVQDKIASAVATGYSAAGTVLEVGDGIDDLYCGDRVACAGAGHANHAEVICVPRNLAVRVPDGVDNAAAATATLGAIALQGVRRANPTLGETFVVLGLGVLGQLTVQLLRANGCRAIGVDLDRQRLALARELGMDAAVHPADNQLDQVARLTEGIGADGVIITAATPANEVVSAAFQMCRRKGRVVLVGDVGLHLNRADFYTKELDFFISTSYGPGRYDRHYEDEGLDYPIGYVRWTENRNLQEYLRLLDTGRVTVAPLLAATYPVTEAPRAYAALKNDTPRPLTVLLSYPQPEQAAPPCTRVTLRTTARPGGPVRIAVIGAGNFARGMHLPNIQKLQRYYSLRAVVSRTGPNALNAARQFGAAYAATDYRDVLNDAEVDAVLLATRHDLHAGLAAVALRAGKHVLVEKPLALTEEELELVSQAVDETQAGTKTPLLLTGFNRRFAPLMRKVTDFLKPGAGPLVINYRMNAGYLPPTHWVHAPEGGGRNRGEACHLYDLFTFLTGSRVRSVQVEKITPPNHYYLSADNFVATLGFADSSVATLTYTAMGSPAHPKEAMEIFAGGKTVSLRDYKQLELCGTRAEVQATRIALDVEERLRQAQTQSAGETRAA
jgi:predicted dehydrogenase